MTYRRTLSAACIALAAAMAGCSNSGPEAGPPAAATTAAAAAPTSAAPTSEGPISDEPTIRQICNHIVDLSELGSLTNTAPNVDAGRRAERVTDPAISEAGRKLAAAAGAASAAPGPDTNLDMAEAYLDMKKACTKKYGEGPW
ncbi:hypothetical protein [Micromonospora carbonacea]|uniref:hypothetical protein n=1 Tax=Micromonospora carbonacea TaxID=47853 RepID=UPI00371B2769